MHQKSMSHSIICSKHGGKLMSVLGDRKKEAHTRATVSVIMNCRPLKSTNLRKQLLEP